MTDFMVPGAIVDFLKTRSMVVNPMQWGLAGDDKSTTFKTPMDNMGNKYQVVGNTSDDRKTFFIRSFKSA